jgi:hypothetical protein
MHRYGFTSRHFLLRSPERNLKKDLAKTRLGALTRIASGDVSSRSPHVVHACDDGPTLGEAHISRVYRHVRRTSRREQCLRSIRHLRAASKRR